MSVAAPSPYVYIVQEPTLQFAMSKVELTYNNYNRNRHAGVTLVMGHPFADDAFRKVIANEQKAIQAVFEAHGIQDCLELYDVNFQVHATLIELATQHDGARNDQSILSTKELEMTKPKPVIDNEGNFVKDDKGNIQYKHQTLKMDHAITWIKETKPFYIELGPEVLAEAKRKESIRITDSGQIVMKGRAKDRELLATIRAEFEKQANIVHKYTSTDDEFFFVIGYLKPDFRIQDKAFRFDLEKCINERRPNIQTAMKVDRVRVVMYQDYSLSKEACLWQSQELKLGENPDLPQGTLIETIKNVIAEKQRQLEEEHFKQAM